MSIKDRHSIIKGINSPLGFFVLALLIVESFLGLVLSFVDIAQDNKGMFIWLGCSLFILVTIFVFLLVWFKPQNLTFDKDAHLTFAKEKYGDNESEKNNPQKDKENLGKAQNSHQKNVEKE
jgi:hypothetical protein